MDGNDLCGLAPSFERAKRAMEKWFPVFFIVGAGVAFFALLFLVDSLKRRVNKPLVKPYWKVFRWRTRHD